MTSWREPLWPWLRVLIFLAAAGGIAACALWAAGRYDDVMAFRQASVCHGTAHHGCLVQASGTVVDRRTSESCTTDSNGVEHCTTSYELRVRRPDRTQWLGVDAGTYDDAHRGDPAELRIWHGAVVRMTVDGHTETYSPPSSDSMAWRLSGAWLFLGLGSWAVVSGRPSELIAFPNFGWLWLTIPFVMVVHGVLLGDVPELAWAGLMGAFGVAWMVFAWRM
ncbi:hypothetical protein [Streptomyces roseochromogenus]|uniref:Uncharacterized protein n=1 Tax=Streptomyces roseochromogenus subsp. oscitans DS 12.976 TaxID=1352936 RepID=V6JGS3_STRRC|nr:hypothetical protein [Streptomyces roseochromogenus]EST19102.1 hypothetical protein M878_43325 [Streptomyces roseochromogenus subsp. oscitans DS 12.976]